MQTTVVKPPAAAALGAGEDVLLVRLAGLAEMDVDVDQARAHDEALCVDDFGGFLLRCGEAGGDFAVGDEDIADLVPLGGGIDDAAVFDPEKRHGKGLDRINRMDRIQTEWVLGILLILFILSKIIPAG
jgi:hypothetical protein